MLQLTIHTIVLLKNIWNQEVKLINFNMCCVISKYTALFGYFFFLSNKMGTFF